MSDEIEILRKLNELSALSPKGFAIAYQIQLTTPGYLFQNYSEAWNKYYSENGMVMSDPTVLWGFENEGIVLWSALGDLDHKNMMGKAAKFGLRYGVTWAHSTGDSRSIGSFARDDREFVPEEITELVKLATQIHDLTLDRTRLSDRDMMQILDAGFSASQTVG